MPNTRQAFQEALLERSKKEKAMTGIHVGFFPGTVCCVTAILICLFDIAPAMHPLSEVDGRPFSLR